MFFGEEDMSVLTHNVWPGYFGDDIALWNVVTGSPRWNYNDLTSNLQTLSDSDPLAITTMTFQDDIILLGGLDGYYNDRNFYGYGVHLWDIRTRHRIKTIRVRSRFDESDIYSMPGLLMAFDSQRPILATSFGDSSVQFHEVETGKRIGEFTSEQEHVRQIVMNPDQDLLAILTDENVAIFDLEMMQIVASFSLLNII